MYLGRKSNLFVYTMCSTYHMPVYTTFLRHLGLYLYKADINTSQSDVLLVFKIKYVSK